jgi:hypothetical protein
MITMYRLVCNQYQVIQATYASPAAQDKELITLEIRGITSNYATDKDHVRQLSSLKP